MPVLNRKKVRSDVLKMIDEQFKLQVKCIAEIPKKFPDEKDYSRTHSCQGLRELHIIHASEPPSKFDRLVFPGYPEEIPAVEVPKSDIFQLILNFLRDLLRMGHLLVGGDDNVPFPASLDGIIKYHT